MSPYVPQLRCCDIFGNPGGDWIGLIANQYGTSGNISEDPLYCEPQLMDVGLQEGSPCAPFSPPNPECGRIGAWPVSCGSSPVSPTSWGRIKFLFLQ